MEFLWGRAVADFEVLLEHQGETSVPPQGNQEVVDAMGTGRKVWQCHCWPNYHPQRNGPGTCQSWSSISPRVAGRRGSLASPVCKLFRTRFFSYHKYLGSPWIYCSRQQSSIWPWLKTAKKKSTWKKLTGCSVHLTKTAAAAQAALARPRKRRRTRSQARTTLSKHLLLVK